MKRPLDIKGDFGFFSTERAEDVLLLNLKENLLQRATSLKTRETLFNYLDMVSNDRSLKIVLLVNSPDKSGREEYLEFYRSIAGPGAGRLDIHRLFNNMNQIILKFMGLNKFVISVDSGRVISLFMNIGLACDYRVVADDTVFLNTYLELGLVPKGGGAYFLSNLLGCNQAARLMLLEESIDAKRALELGLVDEVVPLKSLKEAALNIAKGFALKPMASLLGIKNLLGYFRKGLADYLDHENEVLLNIINSPDFRKGVRES
jgi:2-(1,2-epoxy-1,2-dihydrophenyl)acetyl-CoA isomerase